MTERYGDPGGAFSASAISGASSLPVDWEHPTQWNQIEKYLEPALKEATKKVISMLTENSKSLEDFLAGTVYKVNGGSLYGDVSINGSLSVSAGITKGGDPINPLPVGMIVPFSGTTVPLGWILCDGSQIGISQYSGLYSVIGTTYNNHCGAASPSAGNFRVPNYKGRVLVGRDGSDTTFDSLTDYGGEKSHTLTTAEMPNHNHTQNPHTHPDSSHTHPDSSHTHSDTTHSHGINVTDSPSYMHLHDNYPAGDYVAAGINGAHTFTATNVANSATVTTPSATTSTPSSTTSTPQETATNQPTGGSGSHNNLQPYAVVNYIIKY